MPSSSDMKVKHVIMNVVIPADDPSPDAVRARAASRAAVPQAVQATPSLPSERPFAPAAISHEQVPPNTVTSATAPQPRARSTERGDACAASGPSGSVDSGSSRSEFDSNSFWAQAVALSAQYHAKSKYIEAELRDAHARLARSYGIDVDHIGYDPTLLSPELLSVNGRLIPQYRAPSPAATRSTSSPPMPRPPSPPPLVGVRVCKYWARGSGCRHHPNWLNGKCPNFHPKSLDHLNVCRRFHNKDRKCPDAWCARLHDGQPGFVRTQMDCASLMPPIVVRGGPTSALINSESSQDVWS